MIPVMYNQNIGRKPKQQSKSFVRAGLLSTRMMGFLFLAIMAMVYLAQSTRGATKQVESQSLRTKAEELRTEEDQLRIEKDRLEGLGIISESAQKQLNLELTNEVEFLPNQ
jgi:cell division protein FtsB